MSGWMSGPAILRPCPSVRVVATRIEGPDAPQAREVLVPLYHDSGTKVFGSAKGGKDVHLPLFHVF